MNDQDVTKYRGLVALGLTAILGLGVVGLVAVALLQGFTTELGTILSLVLGGIVGSASTYLGMQAKQGQAARAAELAAPVAVSSGIHSRGALDRHESSPIPVDVEYHGESLGLDPAPSGLAERVEAFIESGDGDAPDAPGDYVGVPVELRGGGDDE